MEIDQTRTIPQNSRLHQWCRELANELNDRGLYMQVVLKPSYDITWTEETVKDHIIRPIALQIARTNRTHQLTKKQLSEVVDIVDKNLLQKFDVDLPFSEED